MVFKVRTFESVQQTKTHTKHNWQIFFGETPSVILGNRNIEGYGKLIDTMANVSIFSSNIFHIIEIER